MTILPEEVLERILALCIASRPSRSLWHPSAPRGPTPSTFLVNKAWLRISTPLFYHTVLLNTRAQALRLATTLASNPALGKAIRKFIVLGCWNEAAGAIRHCTALETLDFTVDAGITDLWCGPQGEAEDFCESMQELDVRTLVVRRWHTPARQLTYVLTQLARAISAWKNLETAHIAIRLSDEAACAVATALSTAPRLHTLSIQLPAVWNPIFLRISTNPRLERIVLKTGANEYFGGDGVRGRALNDIDVIVGTGLFLMEARNFTRLSELIRNGTPIIRTRAHTMGTVSAGAAWKVGISEDKRQGEGGGESVDRLTRVGALSHEVWEL